MRNDARPIGEDIGHQSPVSRDHTPTPGQDDLPIPSERADSRASVKHDRQSHIINPSAEDREPDTPDDPTMPMNDSTLNTKI